MTQVPWHLKGIDPEALEAARNAARRSGVPVGQWLNSLIIDAAANGSAAHDGGAAPDASTALAPHLDGESPHDSDAAAPEADTVLETIGRQIEELSSGTETEAPSAGVPAAGTGPQRDDDAGFGERIDSPRLGAASNGRESERSGSAVPAPQLTGAHLAETISRIDRQLEAMRRSPRPFMPPDMHHGVDQAVAEITARQRALEFGSASPDFSYLGNESSSHIDAATIDHRLRDLGEQIKALAPACRYDGGDEIGRDGHNAASRQTIESIEEQLRHLTSQMGKAPAPVAVDQLVESLRSDLGEMGRRIEEALPHRTATVLQDQILALTAEIAKLNVPRAEEVADVLRTDFAEFRAALKEAVPQHDAASLEDQLRIIVQEVAGLHPPLRAEAITEALRRDLAEFGEALKSAVPQDAAGSLQEQFQALNSRIANLHTPASVEDVAGVLRRDLTQLGEAVRNALPTDAIATLEKEVRALGERIEANRGAGPASPALAELESNLAEVRDRLRALTPSEEMTALTESIRLLTRKADAIAVENAAPEILHQLEQGIVALHALASQVAPPEAFANLSRDIQALSDKIENRSQNRPDPDVMTSLEKRLAELAEAVGRRYGEEPAIPASPSEFDRLIETLVERLKSAQLPAADLSAATNLEHRVVSLIEKLDASEARLGRIDGVERGIDGLLVELKELRAQNERKLAAIQQQLAGTAENAGGPDEAVKRDLAMLREIQSAADRRTQDTFESVYGTVEQVVDRLASIEQGLRDKEAAKTAAILPANPTFVADGPSLAPAASAAALADRATAVLETAEEPSMPGPERSVSGAAAKAAGPAAAAVAIAPAVAAARQPIVSDLPPDAPLEPGSGRRVRVVANAIDRIAASEAAIAGAGGKAVTGAGDAGPAGANFVAAARRAAQAAASEQASPLAADARTPEVKRPSRGRRLMRTVSFIALGLTFTMVALAGLGLAVDLLQNRSRNAVAPPSPAADEPAPTSTQDPSVQAPFLRAPSLQAPSVQEPSVQEPSVQEPSSAPSSPPPPSPLSSPPISPPADTPPPGKSAALAVPVSSPTLGATMLAGIAAPEDFAPVAPTPVAAPSVAPPAPTAAPAPPTDATGMLSTKPAAARSSQSHDAAAPTATASSPVPHDSGRDSAAVPAAIGGKTLRDAAAAGEPAASYEVAIRFAEGRNVPQDMAQAAVWFDRAARRGLAPAQFRLGSMYEKGLGLNKDLQEARRLYLAAADKGNAKAMHNLAVLYAEGLEGKPDYAVASQWFRKAATFGIVDSQYNLAILQARGIGVDQNLAESYKWLALAARGGDKDAAKKRDEVATHLDAQQLESAKLAVEAFAPEHQPDEAIDVKPPAGGWDPVAVAAPGKKTPR